MTFRAIHQMLPCLSYEDAIGNYTLYLREVLRRAGYRSEIFADEFHPRLAGEVRPYQSYEREDQEESILLYHFSVGSAVTTYAATRPRHRVLIYHNITPAHYFVGVNDHLVGEIRRGRAELAALRDAWPLALCDSAFNAGELRALGYRDARRLGIPLDLERYEAPGSPSLDRVLARTEGPLVLFVGRVTPNKGVHHLLRAFATFQRRYAPAARLALVGLTRGFEPYARALRAMAADLRLRGLHMAGHVSRADLLSFYRGADVFCCLSEHEGFCVPLIEAMVFEVPILALAAGAVPETLGGAGLLVDTTEPDIIAGALDRLCRDEALRRQLIEGQSARLQTYRADPPEDRLWRELSDFFGTPLGPEVAR